MLGLEQATWLGKTLVLGSNTMHLVNPQTLVLGVTAMHLEAKITSASGFGASTGAFGNTGGFGQTANNAFGNNNSTGNNGFGSNNNPSAFGTNTSGFGSSTNTGLETQECLWFWRAKHGFWCFKYQRFWIFNTVVSVVVSLANVAIVAEKLRMPTVKIGSSNTSGLRNGGGYQ